MAQLEINDNNTKISDLFYLIREPEVKSESNKAIILLHGVGSNEQDLFSLAESLPSDFYVISVRGPIELGGGRFAWYNVDFSTGKPIINAEQELSSREVIRKFIVRLKQKYNLDNIFLGGFSQGAIMSYSVGLTDPSEVKGIISFSGRVLELIQSTVTKIEGHNKLRVFLAHGVQDSTLPIHYARQARVYLEKLGIRLTYNEYQMGHQITEAVLKDLKVWLANTN